MSISIASESLWVLFDWGAKYLGVYFGVKHNMSLYKPLITLVQAMTVFSNLTTTKATFNLGFRDSINQLIKADSFHPVSLA